MGSKGYISFKLGVGGNGNVEKRVIRWSYVRGGRCSFEKRKVSLLKKGGKTRERVGFRELTKRQTNAGKKRYL